MRVGPATLTASVLRASLTPRGGFTGEDVTLRPCEDLPLSLRARQAEGRGEGTLSLSRVSLSLGPWTVPLAPRWWLVWGERVGLLPPRVEQREGLAVGPGLHLPLGSSLGLDAWLLARGDGADTVLEFQSDYEHLQLTVRAGGPWSGASARGALGWRGARGVVALRADGATGERASRALARSPVESLRGGHELALGVSRALSGGRLSGSLELGRQGDEGGLRSLVALALPEVTAGHAALASRVWAGEWFGREARASAGGEARAFARWVAGPVALEGYGRAEALTRRGPSGAWTVALGRVGGTVALPVARRFGGWRHALEGALGVHGEVGTEGGALVAEATVGSEWTGPSWRWWARVRGLWATGALPPRVEAETLLRVASLEAEARLAADAVWASLEARVRWRDVRGQGLSLGYARRARSVWDAAPSWEAPGAGPLDLEGVRARRREVESAVGGGQVALGRLVRLRVDGALDARTGEVLLAGAAVRVGTVCGCASVEASAFWVLGGEVLGAVTATLGR